MTDDSDGIVVETFLYACAGGAVRGQGGALKHGLWAFVVYAVDEVEADHLALEKLIVYAPAKDGWRDLNARVVRAPTTEERVHAMVLTSVRPEACLRKGGCATPKTCDAVGCRHAAYRGIK